MKMLKWASHRNTSQKNVMSQCLFPIFLFAFQSQVFFWFHSWHSFRTTVNHIKRYLYGNRSDPKNTKAIDPGNYFIQEFYIGVCSVLLWFLYRSFHLSHRILLSIYLFLTGYFKGANFHSPIWWSKYMFGVRSVLFWFLCHAFYLWTIFSYWFIYFWLIWKNSHSPRILFDSWILHAYFVVQWSFSITTVNLLIFDHETCIPTLWFNDTLS